MFYIDVASKQVFIFILLIEWSISVQTVITIFFSPLNYTKRLLTE